MPQQPSGSTSQSQQNPMTQYMQEYRARYGSDISPSDPYLAATFPNFYSSGGSTDTQMPSSTYFDPTPTAGNNSTRASKLRARVQ